MDVVVKSIECWNILILDRNAHLHVPAAIVDQSFTVGIGGNVVLEATTINFRNSTIDFSGATINNFTGNINGNITFEGNLNTDTLTANTVYTSAFYGDIIVGGAIVGGSLTGPVNGAITTSTITEATPSGGILVSGNLIAPTISGNVYGNTIGVLYGSAYGSFVGVGTGTFDGTFDGNVFTDDIYPSTFGGDIRIHSNIQPDTGYYLLGDAILDNLTLGNLSSASGGAIVINGDLISDNLTTGNLTVTDLFTAVTFVTSHVISPLGTFIGIETDTISDNGGLGITFIDETHFTANVDAINVQTTLLETSVLSVDTIGSLTPSNDIIFTSNIIVPAFGAVTLQANVISTDLLTNYYTSNIVVDSNLILTGYLDVTDIISDNITVGNISEAVVGQGISVLNDTNVTGNLYVTNTVAAINMGALTLTGTLVVQGGDFVGLSATLTDTTNQIVLGDVTTTTLSAIAPASSLVYTIPDVDNNASFVMTEGAQTINGAKTFTTPISPTSGGTGLAALGPAVSLLGMNFGGTAFEYKSLSTGVGVLIGEGPGSISITNIGVTDWTGGTTGLTSASSTGSVVLMGTLVVANGGTNSSAALTGNRIMISSGGAIIEGSALTNGQLLIGSTGAAPVAASISGTTNQVTVTSGAGTITLSLPQNVHTGATPTFASETLTATTNQLTLGTGFTTIITAPTPSVSRVYTIPDADTNAKFILSESSILQLINGDIYLTGNVALGSSFSTDTLTLACKVTPGILGATSIDTYAAFIPDTAFETIVATLGGSISVNCYYTSVSIGAGNQDLLFGSGLLYGQIKVIQLVSTAGGNLVVYANFEGGTNITMTTAGTEITLMWNDALKWRLIKNVAHTPVTPLAVLA